MHQLAICLCFLFLAHGGHVAEYYFVLNGTSLDVKFVIEKEELLSFELSKTCDVKSMTALCTVRYLNDHSSLKINGEAIQLELQSAYTEQDHLIILMNAEIHTSEVKNIAIENNCFYAFNPDFRNRIILDVAQFNKSYLLKRGKNKVFLK